VTWTKDGKPLTSTPEIEVKYKNGVASVIVAEIFPEDAGRYACKATNTKGSVETSSKVKVQPMAKKTGGKAAATTTKPTAANGALNGSSSASAASGASPRIFTHTRSTVSKDGDPVRLECTVAGDARFDVVWLHDEREIKPSKDFEYKKVGDNTHVLEIHEVFPEDAGTYTCEAFNDVGECFSTCTLVVEEGDGAPEEERRRPRFTRFPSSLTVGRGATASFEAECSDSAPKEVAWMKDGKQLRETPMKVRVTAAKGKLTLDVMECGASDAGQYAIIVSTEKGEVKAAFSLNVN